MIKFKGTILFSVRLIKLAKFSKIILLSKIKKVLNMEEKDRKQIIVFGGCFNPSLNYIVEKDLYKRK